MRLCKRVWKMSAASVSVDCLYHIRAVSVLSIYTYVGNAGMRKELRQMHVAVTDEETASPEYESAYADYKRPMAECMIHWICVRFWNRKKKEWI